MKNKILSLDKLEQFIKKAKSKNKKIVLCHGVLIYCISVISNILLRLKIWGFFDCFSHSRKFVNKGPFRPVFNDKFRLEALAALETVDYVCLNSTKTATQLIKKSNQMFIVKDQTTKK